MQLAVICLAVLALMLSPCAWDTDPRAVAASSALLARAGAPTNPPKAVVQSAVTRGSAAAQGVTVDDR